MIKKFKSLDEVLDITSDNIFKPKVAVIGIGGAGTNALNNMIEMGLSGVKFIVINTDSQSLEKSSVPHKLQIGPKVTKGLGAGSKPEVGIQAAEESTADIADLLEGINLLFITCGMGGGTGTGASQVIAKIAKDLSILTIAFVTKPFVFEGNQRMDTALIGINELEKYADSLVVISNQSLFSVIEEKTTMFEAFKVADNILYSGVKSITDLIVSNGVVNLDFNDIKSVVEDMGRTMIASAEASGENRAESAAKQVVYNALLDTGSLRGAKKALINITGGADMTLYEVDTIVSFIKGELDSDAFISFGTIYDEAMNNHLCVSVVATGLTTNANGDDILNMSKSISHDKNVVKQKIMQHQHQQQRQTHKPQEQQVDRDELMKIHHGVEFVLNENHEEIAEKASLTSKPIKESRVSKNFTDEVEKEELVNNDVKVVANVHNMKLPNKNYSVSEEPLAEADEVKYFSYDNQVEMKQEAKLNEVKPKSLSSLFNLITSKNFSEENSLTNDNKVTANIKNNMKENSNKNDEYQEEVSFFDIPSFLRKRN